MYLRWLTVLRVFACSACAPVPVHRYVADVPDGELVYVNCPLNGTPANVAPLHFRRRGLIVFALFNC